MGTHWRICPEDADKVPYEDCPEAWGRRDGWIEAVRQQRHPELNASTNASVPNPSALHVDTDHPIPLMVRLRFCSNCTAFHLAGGLCQGTRQLPKEQMDIMMQQIMQSPPVQNVINDPNLIEHARQSLAEMNFPPEYTPMLEFRCF